MATIKEILIDGFLLNESGIKIPKGTHAAKIIYHADLDGIFSAILTRQQLMKQGISSKNIKLSSIQYGVNNQKAKRMLSAKKGQMVALVDFARVPEGVRKPDFWSDHHINEEEESKGGALSGKIGKTEYGSEAEHLATVHAKGLAEPSVIKAITNIDSAKYKKLADVIDLPKDFKAKGRMDRLANITNVLISPLIKSNPTAINQLIKQSSPSLVSIYNNVLKMSKLNNQQVAAIKEINSQNPDWSKIEKARTSMSPEMAKEIRKGERKQATTGLEAKIKRGKKDIEKQTTAKTTQFRGKGNVIIQNAPGRGQPSRFLGSLLTRQDNTRYGALLREWPTMFQIALNPDLPEEAKKRIDLTKIVQEAIAESEKAMGKFTERWAWNIIKKEAGGHAGIATVGALGTIGLMLKNDRDRMKELQALGKRVKKLKHSKKKLEDIMPNVKKELDELLKQKEKTATRRKDVMKDLKERVINKVNKKLEGVRVTKPIRGQERFKVKIKEDIISKIS